VSFFKFVDSCFTDPYATLGRIHGGARNILKSKELILPNAIKMTAAGLSTWALGKLTNFSFISKCSIPAAALTVAYVCWENGRGTTEHLTGIADDFAKTVDSSMKKIGRICEKFGRWAGTN
jgi:hypothetical protein